MMPTVHRPVLVEETTTGLNIKEDGTYFDGTVGAGGHAEAILEKLGDHGRLIGVDCDAEILQLTRQRLERFGNRVILRKGHYDEISLLLAEQGAPGVDGILLDLGVSSWQLDRSERGFSFLREGPLDMRMDLEQPETAADWVASRSERDLKQIFQEWGEERFSGRIARAIVETRRRQPIRTTTQLASLISEVVPRSGKIHPATRVFQGLRIAVNRELERLVQFLEQAPACLNPGGRVAVIAYHSLEDRLVKRAWLRGKQEGRLRILTKKPIVASEAERGANPRARSAKLRLAERIGP